MITLGWVLFVVGFVAFILGNAIVDKFFKYKWEPWGRYPKMNPCEIGSSIMWVGGIIASLGIVILFAIYGFSWLMGLFH